MSRLVLGGGEGLGIRWASGKSGWGWGGVLSIGGRCSAGPCTQRSHARQSQWMDCDSCRLISKMPTFRTKPNFLDTHAHRLDIRSQLELCSPDDFLSIGSPGHLSRASSFPFISTSSSLLTRASGAFLPLALVFVPSPSLPLLPSSPFPPASPSLPSFAP